MKTKLIAFVLVIAFIQGNAQSKLPVASIIQENQITDFKSQKLILIDFWATWCVPCIPAARQLEIYQEQLKEEVYMIGLSDENEYKIRRFLEKQDLRMAIYQDDNFYNVNKFDVQYRPYSVLLNAEGKMIWAGRPSDLNVEMLRNFADRQGNYVNGLGDIFEFRDHTLGSTGFSSIDTSAIFAESLPEGTSPNAWVKTDSRIYFEGSLDYLYSKILGLPVSSIKTEVSIKLRFGADAEIWADNKNLIIEYLNGRFNLIIERRIEKIQVKELKLVNRSLLWDTNQIDWGENQGNNYIIGDQRIEADNLSISEISVLLSELKNETFIYRGGDNKKYDWSFHYNFENLMKEELLYQFGIEIIPGVLADIEMVKIKNSNS